MICLKIFIAICFFAAFTFVEPHGNLIIPYSWLDTDGKGMTISPSKIGVDIGITGIFLIQQNDNCHLRFPIVHLAIDLIFDLKL